MFYSISNAKKRFFKVFLYEREAETACDKRPLTEM